MIIFAAINLVVLYKSDMNCPSNMNHDGKNLDKMTPWFRYVTLHRKGSQAMIGTLALEH